MIPVHLALLWTLHPQTAQSEGAARQYQQQGHRLFGKRKSLKQLSVALRHHPQHRRGQIYVPFTSLCAAFLLIPPEEAESVLDEFQGDTGGHMHVGPSVPHLLA